MAYKRVDGKKIAKGILAAVAIYYLGSLLSGSFESSEDAADGLDVDLGETGEMPAMQGLDIDPPAVDIGPAPEAPSIQQPAIEAPKVEPVQPAQTVAPTAAVEQKSESVTASTPTKTTTASKPPDQESSYGKWLSKLSPDAKAIIAGGMFQGAGAMLQGYAQKNALEDAREREERARQDKIRRGSIPAFGRGIIASRRG